MSSALPVSFTVPELAALLHWDQRRTRRYLSRAGVAVDKTERGRHIVWLSSIQAAAPAMAASLEAVQGMVVGARALTVAEVRERYGDFAADAAE